MTRKNLEHLKMLTEYRGGKMNKHDEAFYRQDLNWALDVIDFPVLKFKGGLV